MKFRKNLGSNRSRCKLARFRCFDVALKRYLLPRVWCDSGTAGTGSISSRIITSLKWITTRAPFSRGISYLSARNYRGRIKSRDNGQRIRGRENEWLVFASATRLVWKDRARSPRVFSSVANWRYEKENNETPSGRFALLMATSFTSVTSSRSLPRYPVRTTGISLNRPTRATSWPIFFFRV